MFGPALSVRSNPVTASVAGRLLRLPPVRGTTGDVEALALAGAEGAVVGRALLEGRIQLNY